MERWEIIENLVKNRIVTGRAAEIGVWKAETTAHLLSTLQNVSSYFAVDPFQDYSRFDQSGSDHKSEFASYEERQFGFDDLYNSNRLKIEKEFPGRAIWIRKFSHDAAELIEDGSLDFAFLDGNHCYEYISRDIKDWSRKIRPGGVLIGHDWSTTAGGDFVDGEWTPNPEIPHPTQKAVKDFFGSDYAREKSDIWYHCFD